MTDSMTDEEIRENLLKLGTNVGPVVDSTREFYRRKLARLMGELKEEPEPQGRGTEGSASEKELSDKEFSDKEEERIEQIRYSEPYSPPERIRSRRSIHASTDLHSPVKSSYNSEFPSITQAKSTSRGSVAKMLCFVVGSALILFYVLVFQSNETAIESK